MTTDDQLYTSHILKKAIISYLDKNVPNTEEGLNVLLSQCDELVWDIAVKIHTQSGHKVEFSIIRDIINARIQSLKVHVADLKAKEARRLELETKRLVEEAQRKRKEEAKRLAEEAQRKREEEARRLELETKRLAEEAQRKQEAEVRLNELARQLKESGRDESLSDLFLTLQDIVVNMLKVKLEYITLDSDLSHDLGADEYDVEELVMAIEEYFDIEIPDTDSVVSRVRITAETSKNFGIPMGYYVNAKIGEILDYIYQNLEK